MSKRLPEVRARILVWIISLMAGAAGSVRAADAPGATADQVWAVHAQATVVDQGHPAFAAPYAGADSLPNQAQGRETLDITLFAGARPWRGAELWLNPEIDQGFGLGDTLGAAGFPSGEAYKVGRATPYLRLQRAFLRQTIDLGGTATAIDPDLNQLGARHREDRLVITIGKFGVTDIFDANAYAHDPKHDFLNWGVIDAGTFDYAADAWGYSEGLAVEWYKGLWTLRSGLFDLSDVPNSARLDPHFGQFQWIEEIERRFTLRGQPGSVKATAFLTRGRMGLYADALALGAVTATAPDVSKVRRYRSRSGLSLDLQQQATADLGVFLRGGLAGGAAEPYEFADIDRTISGGVSLKGRPWGRPGDTFGLSAELNGISRLHQAYLAAGGLGILIGDGRLPHPGTEGIVETYYDIPLGRFLHFAADYQFIDNPAYNRDRGPVSIFAGRLHAQF